MNRRGFLAATAVLAGLGAKSMAQGKIDQVRLSSDPGETVRLWPATPPGGDGVHLEIKLEDYSRDSKIVPDRMAAGIGDPVLQVLRAEKPNGAAMLVMPGGGYASLWFDKEGYEISRRFNRAGITCFVLFYRLPGEGWAARADVPLADAQRAIRLIRSNAAKFAIDPARLGVMGFSAGGHLAASLATRFDAKVYAPVDAADRLDARPAFAALLYPVITMGAGTHQGSRDLLLGPDPSPERIAAYSCENLVTAKMPPTFIAHAADDGTVPFVPNALAMYRALLQAKVPSEFHAFEQGGHGFALRGMHGQPWTAWPELFLAWAQDHKFAAA